MHIKSLLRNIFENLDVILGILAIIIGTIIFSLSYLGRINQFFIGLALILSSFIYLLLRSRLKEDTYQNFHLSFQQKNALHIIFFVLIIVTSLLWYNQLYSRPVIYFVLLSLTSGLIAIEIYFFTKDDPVWPALLKIFFLAMVIRLGIFYNFPSIMGFDAYLHANIANVISSTGFVPPLEISHQYVNYPILHIFIAITQILSFISIKDAIFLSIGLVSIICTLFVFIFVNHIAGPRIGLLSVLMICVTTQIIVTGITNITAGSLVLCYFLMLLCLFRYREKYVTALILCQFIMFIMIITHQLTIFTVILTLCLFAFSIFLFDHIFPEKRKDFKIGLFLAIFGISMLLYWIYTPLYQNESFFEATFGPFIEVLLSGGEYGSDVLIVGQGYVRPLLDTVVVQTSYLILPFFAIGGIFFWVSRKDAIKFSIACTAAVVFFLVYAIPFLGIRNLLTDRWMPFVMVFLGILGAAYIISCIDIFNSKTVKIITIVTIISIFSFLMITIPQINKDNPLVSKETTIRNQYTYSEIGAAETIKAIHGGMIIVDPEYVSPFGLYGGNNTLEEQIDFGNSFASFTSESELLAISENYRLLTVLRKSTVSEPITLSVSELYADRVAIPLSKTIFENYENAENQNLVYSNGNVISYYSQR